MRRIETLNSVYEVDGNKIRRVSGVNDPTKNFGKDGEWREFTQVAQPHGLVIFFADGGTTITSQVLSEETV